jgi:hypothetical protein
MRIPLWTRQRDTDRRQGSRGALFRRYGDAGHDRMDPGGDDPIAVKLNSMRKHVASRTLDRAMSSGVVADGPAT